MRRGVRCSTASVDGGTIAVIRASAVTTLNTVHTTATTRALKRVSSAAHQQCLCRRVSQSSRLHNHSHNATSAINHLSTRAPFNTHIRGLVARTHASIQQRVNQCDLLSVWQHPCAFAGKTQHCFALALHHHRHTSRHSHRIKTGSGLTTADCNIAHGSNRLTVMCGSALRAFMSHNATAT